MRYSGRVQRTTLTANMPLWNIHEPRLFHRAESFHAVGPESSITLEDA